MKRLILILFTVLALVAAPSCKRRPFGQSGTPINLVINIDTLITNDRVSKLPELFRINLYNKETGAIVYADYLETFGGEITPHPGNYHLVLYNINTEATVMYNENVYNEISASTNDLSTFVQMQLKDFLDKRKVALGGTVSDDSGAGSDDNSGAGDSGTKAAVDERIANEPDHIFVGTILDFYVPSLLIGEEQDITVTVDAKSVVETWKVVLTNVDGIQWVSGVHAVASGLVDHTYISTGRDSEQTTSVYFGIGKSEDGKNLSGHFRTFGRNLQSSEKVYLDLFIVDTGGYGHFFHFDITDKFHNNEPQVIVLDDYIKIEKPADSGGGFDPTVDDWEDVNNEIEL